MHKQSTIQVKRGEPDIVSQSRITPTAFSSFRVCFFFVSLQSGNLLRSILAARCLMQFAICNMHLHYKLVRTQTHRESSPFTTRADEWRGKSWRWFGAKTIQHTGELLAQFFFQILGAEGRAENVRDLVFVFVPFCFPSASFAANQGDLCSSFLVCPTMSSIG